MGAIASAIELPKMVVHQERFGLIYVNGSLLFEVHPAVLL